LGLANDFVLQYLPTTQLNEHNTSIYLSKFPFRKGILRRSGLGTGNGRSASCLARAARHFAAAAGKLRDIKERASQPEMLQIASPAPQVEALSVPQCNERQIWHSKVKVQTLATGSSRTCGARMKRSNIEPQVNCGI
jgi:hypothetical protein